MNLAGFANACLLDTKQGLLGSRPAPPEYKGEREEK